MHVYGIQVDQAIRREEETYWKRGGSHDGHHDTLDMLEKGCSSFKIEYT